MKKRLWIASLLLSVFMLSCGAPRIVRNAEESYKLNSAPEIGGKLALFAMMTGGSSSFNVSSNPAKISDSPYSPARIINDSEIAFPGETSMEGFRQQANDIFLAKLKQKKSDFIIIPPQQVQGLISQSDLIIPYLDFLQNYNYLSASPDFLKDLGVMLNCKYLMTTQLVIISTVKDNSVSFVWTFAKRSTDYSVTILTQIWDLSEGQLIWSGRGTSSTVLGVYVSLPHFDKLAGIASEELLTIVPWRQP